VTAESGFVSAIGAYHTCTHLEGAHAHHSPELGLDGGRNEALAHRRPGGRRGDAQQAVPTHRAV